MAALIVSMVILATSFETSLDVPQLRTHTTTVEDEGTILGAEGCYAGCEPGMPDIPVYSKLIALPPGTRASSAAVVHAQWVPVAGSWDIRPLPAPRILSRLGVGGRAEPDPAVWSRDAFWPSRPVELTGTASIDGEPHACLVVSPFRYNPIRRSLERLSRLRIRLTTERGARTPPEAADGEGYARMLIVTSPSLAGAFEELASWRTASGLYTEVATTDTIYGYPGCDNAERIRNFVIDYRTENGLDYLMLGGDTVAVPCRFAFPMSYGTGGGRDDNMPCDLYYSDLDGSWNADGDDTWGEVADDVDLAPDVAVGRAPVESPSEASDFVDKIIAYEEASSYGHLERGLFVAQIMTPDPYTPGAVSKDYLDEMYMPDGWIMTKLYESAGTYGAAATLEALNQGTGCLNVCAHGWVGSAGCLTNAVVEQVDSEGRFAGLAYATSCWSGAFDFDDCVAENYVKSPQGCGVGFIANSSYGWGSPGNPLFGYSDRLDQSVYDHLFADSSLAMGEVLALAKTEYVPFAQQENCYRCLLYMANLMGDPSLVPYRRMPIAPAVEHPDMVTPETSVVPVTVDPPAGSPEGAHVCVSNSDLSIYEVVELDGSGMAILELPQPPSEDLTVTVTGPRLLRYSGVMPIESGPSLAIASVEVQTPEGYWVPAPGCNASVGLELANQGTVALDNVQLSAGLVFGPGELVEDAIDYGSLSPGQTSFGGTELELEVDADAENGELLQLSLTMTADQGSWEFPLPLLVCAPGLSCCSWTADDTVGGNGNGYPEAGEDFDLHVNLANTGLMAAHDVSVGLEEEVSWLSFSADSCSVDSVSADSTALLTFSGSLTSSAPEPGFPRLVFSIEADPELSSQDSLVLTVGNMGFSEDVESGSPWWSHGGTNDLWHITEEAGHSGQCSWYCGLSDTTLYMNNMNCRLQTPELYLGPDAEMTFWSRFDIELYGSDGLYVVFNNLDLLQRDTLDFIGAGGLLALRGPGGNGNMQWLPRTYDLSDYGWGTCGRLEFSFVSDEGGVGGGFWLDDISLCGWAQEPSGARPSAPTPGPLVGDPAPNPCVAAMSVPVRIESGPVSVGLYDLSGRLVWSTDFTDGFSGSVSVPVGGLVSGVYLVRVAHSEGCSTSKAVVLGERR